MSPLHHMSYWAEWPTVSNNAIDEGRQCPVDGRDDREGVFDILKSKWLAFRVGKAR